MSNQDQLLEHNYDGIQEYDNPLPAWWVYLFLGSIVYSVLYVGYYHIGIGPSVIDEYNAEAAAAFERQAAAMEGIEVTEAFLYQQMLDSATMGGMGQVFARSCASCHGANGEGLTCPNLTDDKWLHGGSLMDIYKTIRNGVPGTEMKSWVSELGPARVIGLAAYVGTLRGQNLPGRPPEGATFQWEPPDLEAAAAEAGQGEGGAAPDTKQTQPGSPNQ